MQTVFRKKTERINWRTLAAVDIDRIMTQNDVHALRDNIKHVTFCDIETELELRECDAGLLKLFKLSQLMVDYLLSSQDVLTGAVAAAEERAQLAIEEADVAKRKLLDSESYLGDVKRECHRRKRLILAQQQIMDSGPNAYHRCPYCEKAFLNGSFLQRHLEKRHADRYLTEWRFRAAADDGGHGGHGGSGSTSPRRKKSPHHGNQHGQGNVLTSERVELLLQQLLERSTGGSGRHRKTLSGPENGDGDDARSGTGIGIGTGGRRDQEDRLRAMADAFELDKARWQDEARLLRDEIRQLRRHRDKHGQHRHGHEHGQQQGPSSGGDNTPALGGPSTSEQMERARQKAIDTSRSRKAAAAAATAHDQVSTSPQHRPAPGSRTHGDRDTALRASTESQTAGRLAPGSSPRRDQLSPPRKTSSSPARRDNADRNSVLLRSSNMSLDRLARSATGLDVSQDLLDKFCDEVRHMLDDHLELHGIPRGTTGISGIVLKDKMKLIDHEQHQMQTKYPNYADIRRRLEAEVHQEAMARMVQGVLDKPVQSRQHQNQNQNQNQHQHQHQHQHQQQTNDARAMISAQRLAGAADRDKPMLSARSARSSQSEWDDDSHTRVDIPGASSSPQRVGQHQHQQQSPTRAAPPLPVTSMVTNSAGGGGLVHDHRPDVNPQMRDQSPRKSPDRRGNLHLSSDLSNTIDSSAWQTESKAVTSVPHRSSHQTALKPAGTNRSSDYDDESDFST